ncbi:hypothetical protein EDC04DRAFT_2618347 [Pisolithus marmoratus]|nr:hypothetical protein EDC04DRAFT_2618347 [Pisolithus marmoratus]
MLQPSVLSNSPTPTWNLTKTIPFDSDRISGFADKLSEAWDGVVGMPQGQKTGADIQWAIVWLSKFLDHERIGMCLNLSTCTVQRVLSHFHATGTIPNDKGDEEMIKKPRSKHLRDIDVEFLLGTVQKTPDLYLDELHLPNEDLPQAPEMVSFPDIICWFSFLDERLRRDPHADVTMNFSAFGPVLRAKGFLNIAQLSRDYAPVETLQAWLGVEVGTALVIRSYVDMDLQAVKVGKRVLPLDN